MHVLKAGLSRYVALARGGEVIEVTSHDKPIVRIVGIASTQQPGVARLLASGAAQWAGGRPHFQAAVQVQGGSKSVSDMVLEDRG